MKYLSLRYSELPVSICYFRANYFMAAHICTLVQQPYVKSVALSVYVYVMQEVHQLALICL